MNNSQTEFKDKHPEWSFRMRGDVMEDNRKGFFEATPETRVHFVKTEFVRVFDSPDVVEAAKQERKRLDQQLDRTYETFQRHVNVTVRVVMRNYYSDGSTEDVVVNKVVEDLE